MAGDEQLRIDVKVVGGKEAVDILGKLSDKTKEASDLISKSGWGNKELQTLNKELRSISNSMTAYSKAINAVNDVNSKAAINEQKLANEIAKTTNATAKAELQKLRLAQAQERATQAAQKAASPYNQLNNALKEQANKLKDAITKGNLNDYTLGKMADKYKRLQGELTNVNTKFQILTGTINKNIEGGRVFASMLGNVMANAIENVVSSLGEMIRKMSEAAVQMDGIRNTFAAGARGWQQGGEEMKFVADMANKLGLNLQATYEPYAKFMTSFTRSGGTLAESRQIFEDLAVAMVSLHLPASKMEGVFVALEQMANKGTVQAEELKRQLANALPGAFELAAQSMNILPGELMDLMKKGEVLSKDFLPKFAATVKESLGGQIGIAVDQYNAHLNRMQSQTWLLQANLGTAWNNASLLIVKPATDILKAINGVLKGFSNSAGATTILQTAFLTAGVAAVTFAKQFGIVNTTLTVLKANIIATSKALWALVTNPVAATFMAISAAALYCVNSINKVNKEFAEAAVQQRDVTNSVTGLINEYSSLVSITNKTTAQQEALNRVMETMRTEYPELLQYITTHNINLKTLTSSQADNIASMAVQAKMQEAQKLMMEELGNKWLIFGARAKQVGLGVVAVLQGVKLAIWKVLEAFTTAVPRVFSMVLDRLRKLTAAMSVITGVAGLEGISKQFATVTSSLTKAGDVQNRVITQMTSNSRQAKQELSAIVDMIKNVEIDRQNKALTTYKDTVASLGQEQEKLAKSLIYAKDAAEGLSGALAGEDGKGDKKKSGKTSAKDSIKSTTKAIETEYDKLVKLTNSQEELIKNNKRLGISNKDLENEYIANKKQIDDIQKYVHGLTAEKKEEIKATNEEVKAWKDLKKEAQDATAIYENRLYNSKEYTRSQIEEARQMAKNLNAQVEYTEALKNMDDFLQISARNARKLGDTIVDSLLNPLEEGETIWSRFKDAGISAIKSIFAEWIKNEANLILMGGQAGFAKNTTGNRFTSMLSGMGSAIMRQPLEGTKESQAVSEDDTTFSSLIKQANQLTEVINGSTKPATEELINTVTSVGSNVSSIANPIADVAGSISSMATSVPVVATGIGVISAALTASSAAFSTTAPAIATMASSMATLATSTTTAATAMAALAVATAAESVAKIPMVGGFLAPAAATLTGAAIAAGTAMTGASIAASSIMAGSGNMIGGAMSGIGSKLSGVGSNKTNVIPHAKGGIVSSPTMFPMQGGNIGVAGEAGTEVIAPARRMSNGDLGIGAVQPNVTVNNYTNAAVEVIKRPDNEMEIKITELNAMLASSRTNKGMTAAQSRMSSQGRRIG